VLRTDSLYLLYLERSIISPTDLLKNEKWMVIKLMKTLVRFVKYLIFPYCITGLVYSAAGYVYREVIGKQEVFSP